MLTRRRKQTLAGDLAQLAQDVGLARDLRGVFDALRVYALSLTGGNALFVSLLDSQRRERWCVFAWADGEEVDVSALPPLPMTGGPHARAVASGEPVIVNNLQLAMSNMPNVPVGYDLDPRSPHVSIALPLAVLGRVIGGFEIQIFEHADPYRCVPGLRVAANLAAVAIENVRLLEGERVARARAEALQERFGLLAEVGAVVARSLETDTVLTGIAEVLVPRLADCCWVDLQTEGAQLRTVAVEANDVAAREAARTLRTRFSPSPATATEMRRVMREGQPLLVDLDRRRLAARARNREHRELLARLRPVSLMIVPLSSRGSVVGAMTLLQRSIERRYAIDDVLLAQNVAERAAAAIDNARLYRDARQAEDSLRRLNEELELRVRDRTTQLARTIQQLKGLGEITRAIISHLNLEEVLVAVVTRAVQLSGADDGVVFESDPASLTLSYRVSHAVSEPEAQMLATIGANENDETIVSHVTRTGSTVEVADLEDLGSEQLGKWKSSRLLQASESAGMRALLLLPMRCGEELAGVLLIRCKSPGAFPAATVELLETFAAQSAVAIQNARLFQQLEQKSRDLEIASKHKSNFLASMSHELRTPLNAIIGFAEVLLDRTPEEIPHEDRARYLEHIQRSGKQLLGLINDILDLSKVEAGRMELFVEPFRLADIIDDCMGVIRVVALGKHLRLDSQVNPADLVILADPTRLRQIIYNLLSNAVKYTPDGGWVRVNAHTEDGFVVIAVADNGIGIKTEDQLHIFEEFRQASTSQANPAEGTGLGLALVRRLAELHGGSVELESAPGEGSCFRVRVPARQG